MKARIHLLSLLTLCAHWLAVGQVGNSGLAFLKLGVGARSLGMGETAAAAARDASATHYNPAALSLLQNPQLLVMHKEWIQGSQTEFLAASVPLGSLALGVSLYATSIPDIEIRTRPGPAEGTFSARNAAIGLSAAYEIESTLGVGFSLKYLYEKIFVDEANGLGFDVGATYATPWEVRLGFSLSNVGSMGKLRTEASKLPTTLRFGAVRSVAVETLTSEVTIAADIVSILPEKTTHLHLGGEYEYDRAVALRLGYMTGYESRGFSAGAGLRWGMFRVDYAFIPFTFDLGTTHTFSLGMEF